MKIKTNVSTIRIFLIELQRSIVVKVELNCQNKRIVQSKDIN